MSIEATSFTLFEAMSVKSIEATYNGQIFKDKIGILAFPEAKKTIIFGKIFP